MKPPPFAYDRVESVAEAVQILAAHGDEARVLAGGQSLMPMLNLRVARPGRLVDVGPLDELNRLGVEGERLVVGALVPHAVLERHATVKGVVPVLSRAAANIGHPAIRRRGTLGGSIAHADPSAELIAAGSALGAYATLDSHEGRRTVGLVDLVVGPYETTIRATELLTWLSFEIPDAESRTGFYEVAPREGDFATVGAVWYETTRLTRVAIFGADVGHLVVEVEPGAGAHEILHAVRERRRLTELAAHRLFVAVTRAEDDAHV